MSSQATLRIVIVGGVAGGMSAATRARRCNENASIIVLEKGEHISFANCGLPYYLDGRISSKEKLLLTTPAAVAARYRIEARVRQEVVSIDRSARTVEVRDLGTGNVSTLGYDKLILAPGASPIVPPIPNIQSRNVFLVRNVADILAVDAYRKEKSPRQAVIIGAGYIGLEMADTLTHAGVKVTIIEKMPQPMPLIESELLEPLRVELAKNNVELITGDGLLALEGSGDVVRAARTESGKTVAADMVILSIGVRPNVGLAQAAGLTLGASGAIAVNEYQQTSDPDIYAAGDATETIHGVTGKPVRLPLAGPANRAGRLAGEHAATGRSAAAGRVLGTSIVECFGVAMGLTGLSQAAAVKAGFDADTACVLPSHHAGYYPGAQQMRLKLVYERGSGRILGAQAVGRDGVDKRLDVIATAIHFRGTIHDLAQLDLAYAPQFGSAKDAVHYAAFVAQNQESGLTPAAASATDLKDAFLLDVRTSGEFAAGALAGATNIPLDSLRDRLNELPRQRRIAVTCQVGLRGHVATRILRQRGFDAVNLKGGYLLGRARQP
jgi:NADPH-dependent 2,4-dienoyl-CoA reductase/sulfur reductase-like enzyme/rhodanese-related sulfurtransferase